MRIERENDWDKLIIENEDDFAVLSEAYAELCKRAVPIAQMYLELKGEHPAFGIDEDNISIDSDGDLRISYETGGRGYYEDETMYLPAKYLFDPKWIEEAKTEIEEQREQARQEAERKRLEAEAKKKKQEYEKYLKLKDQFEGGV